MNNESPKFFRYTDSNAGCLLTMLLLAIVLGSLGLGWVFKTIIIAIALSIVLPIVAWFVLRWWLQKNLVQDKCPVCNYEFTGFGKTEFNCPSCGEPLKVESGKFK
ncbi:MAG: hypothetical protein D6756_05740, partial [Cyanobacteria bacterium J083]